MAVDIWTLNLQFEEAPPGKEYVQREMDRDEICFFNLIGLIEEYGYKSVDYLYYKRRDSLVAIEWDVDVMEMLKENESKKQVSLLVTKQRMAIIASTKSNKEPTKSAPNKTKEKRVTKKKQRLNIIQTKAQYTNELDQLHDDDIQETPGDGDKITKRKGTVLTHVWDLPEEKRIVVKCNQLGQPIGKEGGLLGQFLGTIARNGGYCPVNVKDWRKVRKGSAETILQCIQTKFLYPRSCEKWILKSVGRDWRKYKATIKKKLFNPKKKRSALYKLCPDDIDEDQWKELIRYWKSKEGKAQSEKNKESCEMKKTTHNAGTKSYARWFEDLKQADPTRKQPHRTQVYLATHRKRVKGTNEPVVQLEKLIDKQPESAQNSKGLVAWEGDALHQVSGEKKPGQVHAMGLLPMPKQVYGHTTRRFKDINITSIDGSSPDVETHVLEEIKQLKEHARNQDKVIDELKNTRRHNENEPTKANSISNDHANFQNHEVHSNRKRVQCADPNHGGALCEQRDELCHHGANYKELSYHEEVDPSSPQCSANDIRHKKTTTMTQQVAAHDKATSHKRSKNTPQPPPIKVGSTVILKSAKYPNKEIAAYATLLSSSPKANVSGVEIGKLFYKVRINHPVLQDEPLVRPMTGYNVIGDAHAKRAPIAWASICVEMING